ncbi:MAG: helix-turn-helix transcriptional regulator [Candidatus Thiodiazotropha taylori]
MFLVNEQALYENIGAVIKKRRQSLKLTQSDVAERVGITRTSVTNIEQGTQKPPVHLLYRFCHELRLSLDEVLPDPDLVFVKPVVHEEQVAMATATEEVVVSRGLADLIETVKQST